ncbi:MAG: RND family transporter [Alphaproteobacteria bacterium]|nr:RND family transporter [Alphaproteobacteria bacterium]
MFKISSIYEKIINKYTKIFTLILIIFLSFALYYSKNFYLDASADSLSLKNDQDLTFYREIKEKYISDDYLVITYAPKTSMFTKNNLKNLENLHQKLAALENIDNVISILNIPLLRSPPRSLQELAKESINLLHPDVDLASAPNEILTSPLYKNALISPDGKITALLVFLTKDEEYNFLLKERNKLRNKSAASFLTPEEQAKLEELTTEFKIRSRITSKVRETNISEVRGIMKQYKDVATMYLGGVPMIMSDSLNYIKSDMVVFGSAVLIFIIFTLAIAFKSVRFVILPLTICFTVTLIMIGFLGFTAWPVTTVSSNFIALLLILTLSINIHLTVKYREEYRKNPKLTHRELILISTKKMAKPCFYTTLTTMVAFASLILSGLKPVIDFGWMMFAGLAISYLISLMFFPILHSFLNKPKKVRIAHDITHYITEFFAKQVEFRAKLILGFFMLLFCISIYGISKLSVENRFIDYYKKDTEIYQGMKLIDENLGGTTPLEIIIDAPPEHFEQIEAEESFNIFGLEEENTENEITKGYWFNSYMFEQINDYHNYLDNLPETGKVLSLDTTLDLFSSIDPELISNSFTLAILYNKLPLEIKKQIFDPFISADGNQLRYSIRIYESSHNLKRNDLLLKIKKDFTEKFNLAEDQFRLTGMLVLYNNILQTLFKSQILTIGAVFLLIFIMFYLLFRNIRISLIAIIPNILAASFILGIMGLLGISLDIMTITIAAIVIGIAVDNTIHYIHRFIEEYKIDNNYIKAMYRSHESIGRAMYFTTIIITLGFSILILSNFIPTIYFGFLTSLSMLIALILDLVLLPTLIIKLKAFK